MMNSLLIKEKYSRFWPVTAIVSLILAIIFFFTYWNMSDVLIQGYLRLISFAFFALGILSLFKIKQGQIELEVSIDNDVIKIQYSLKNRVLQTEEWSTNEIATVKIDEMPNRSLYNDVIKGDRCIRFRRHNQSDWIYLNKLNGRVIPLSQKNAEEMNQFITKSIPAQK